MSKIWRAFLPTYIFMMVLIIIALAALFAGHAWAQAQRIPSDNGSSRFGVTCSANGTTAAVSCSLPAVQGLSAYICGLDFFMTNATAANTNTAVTTTGLANNFNFGYPTLAAAATVPNSPHLTILLTPCQPASAENTAIVVQGPTPGAGATYTSVDAWGYYDRPF